MRERGAAGFEGDHPRMRGEHVASTGNSTVQTGSSPHARGTPLVLHRQDGSPGIIPACAGNTSASLAARSMLRDHPRMRGEHTKPWSLRRFPPGSSPHARGTRKKASNAAHGRGIIPACAGNTGLSTASPSRARDHPRMRGEHWRPAVENAVAAGSSPHARGTLRTLLHN